MYLNIVSRLSATVCNSNLMGHCSQKLNNSSVYPIRKYIFLGCTCRATMPDILMMLCCLLIIISDAKSACQVPVRNFLMNISSIAVSDVRSPPRTLAKIYIRNS